MNKLALGTAQFGMGYGVANYSKKSIGQNEIKEILKLASSKEIDLIDTAMNYGDAEKKLGKCEINKFKIITKVPSFRMQSHNFEFWLKNKLSSSLRKLNKSSLYALLLHNPDDLLGEEGEKFYKIINSLKEEGILTKVGLSIYSPSTLDKLIPRYDFDLIQTPLNLLDTRILDSGWIERLDSAGIEIHARSIFLQGLLLMPIKSIPNEFKPWIRSFKQIKEWSKNKGISLLEACVLFAFKQKKIKKIVIGIDSLRHLKEILDIDLKKDISGLPKLSLPEESLINPSKWKLN